MPFHPVIVHFPIVLIILSGLLYAWSFWKKDLQYNPLIEIIHIAGLLFTGIAIFSGQQAEVDVAHTPEIHKMMELHARLGWVCVWLLGLLFLWAKLRIGRWKMLENLLFVVVLWATIFIMGYGSHIGGKMVYEKGAGVIPMKETLMEEVRKQQ